MFVMELKEAIDPDLWVPFSKAMHEIFKILSALCFGFVCHITPYDSLLMKVAHLNGGMGEHIT